MYICSLKFFIVFRNMKTETIDNKVVEFSDAVRNIDDIKKSYPDEWVLLGNPVSDEYDRTISGVIVS